MARDAQKTAARNLFYSSALLLLAALLAVMLTLGWFQQVRTNQAGALETYAGGTVINRYVSADEDGDGVPDRDEEGEVIYENESGVTHLIENFIPGREIFFKIDIIPPLSGGEISGYLLGLTAPEEQDIGASSYPPGHVFPDLADALRIEYYSPYAPSVKIDSALSALFTPGTRDIELFADFHRADDTPLSFIYRVYMPGTAGNAYQHKRLGIEKALFFVISEE